MKRLSHPNIVRALNIPEGLGYDRVNTTPFICMEYCDGGDLRQVCALALTYNFPVFKRAIVWVVRYIFYVRSKENMYIGPMYSKYEGYLCLCISFLEIKGRSQYLDREAIEITPLFKELIPYRINSPQFFE